MPVENPYAVPENEIEGVESVLDSKIRISRTTAFADKVRAYRVLIDGQEVAQIHDGQTIEIPVSSGRHSIVGKIDWCGSETLIFEVRPGMTTYFSLNSNVTGWRSMFGMLYLTLWKNEYLKLQPV